MYHNPFGSLFGEGSPADNLKKNQAPPPPPGAMPPVLDQKATPPKDLMSLSPIPKEGPPAEPYAPPEEKPSEEMKEIGERLEAVKKEKLSKSVKARKSIDFVATPQFKAITKRVAKNPEVQLEQIKFKNVQETTDLETLKIKLTNLKTKTQGIDVYKNVISNYLQLPESNKQQIKEWILKNIKAINKLSAIKKMEKTTKRAQEAIADIDAKIKHYDQLYKLEKKGINIKGQEELISYSPKKKAAPKKATPKKAASIASLAKAGYVGVKQQQGYAGYGEDVPPKEASLPPKISPEAVPILPPVAPKALPQDTEKDVVVSEVKDTFFESFLKKLPGPRYYMKTGEEQWKTRQTKKGLERNLAQTITTEWKAKDLEKELNKQTKVYNQIQAKVKELVKTMQSADPEGLTIATALGILSEANTRQFMTSLSLLDTLKNSLANPSTLGDDGASTTEETELEKVAATSEAAVRELETKQYDLEVIKAKVEGTEPPPPPPPVIPESEIQTFIKESTKKDIKQEAIKALNKYLPIIAGILIVIKLIK